MTCACGGAGPPFGGLGNGALTLIDISTYASNGVYPMFSSSVMACASVRIWNSDALMIWLSVSTLTLIQFSTSHTARTDSMPAAGTCSPCRDPLAVGTGVLAP